MRLAVPVIAALLLLVAVPTEAPAQRLGRFLGPLAGPVNSLLNRGIRIGRPYGYRARARAARSHAYRARAARSYANRARAVRAAAVPRLPVGPATQHQLSQQQMAQLQSVQPKPFWPNAPQDIFDYVLTSKGTGLWGHGYGAIVASMFAPSPAMDDARASASLETSAPVEQTTGAALASSIEMCGERSVNRAEEMTKQLAGALALADDQQNILAELRSALRQAEDNIAAACPSSAPANLPERLRTMQDRLWTMRVTGTSLRAPLQKFHAALTSEQKEKLDAQAAPNENGSGIPSKEAAMQCYGLTQVAPQWPVAQIARSARLNKDQQARLAILSETSSKMSQLMMGSCPKEAPRTLARLDATLDWLDAMLFAGVNIAVAVDDFYGSLSDEQKAKLDQIDL